MLSKLLFKNQDKKQLVIALIGAFLGMLFLILSIHYSVKINEFGKGTDVLGPNTLMVQKKVTNSSSLNISKTDFTNNEIDKLKQNSFIKDIQPVQSNNFDISFETSDPLVPYFRTDVFIQTIPSDFLDVKTDLWHWKKGDKYVPMIMPREFLVMLNTFMSASGIPQISEDLAKSVKFKFKLWNDEKTEKFDVQIIGFTNEVSSILVPSNFMKFGNLNFGKSTDKKITQVMILGEEGQFGLVEDLMMKRGLEPKNSQLIVGRLKSIVGTLFLLIFSISLIAVFSSFLVLIQYIQLLLTKNNYEIKTLLRLGFSIKQIVKIVFNYFNKMVGLVCLISLLLFLIVKYFIDHLFIKGGLYIGESISLLSIIGLIVIFILFTLLSLRVVKKEVNKLF
jgi:hypothetical protein